jgi:hypothetical protein
VIGRKRRRFRIERKSDATAPLEQVVSRLTDIDQTDASRLLGLARFELDAETTDGQAELLCATLSAAGANVEAVDVSFGEPPRTLCWEWSGYAVPKICFTVAAGGGALSLGVPLVPVAAVVTLGAILVRAARWLPHRLEVSRALAESLLEPSDPAIAAAANAAGAALASPDTVERLGACVQSCSSISTSLRSDGSHLRDAAIGRIDQQLGDLLRQTVRLTRLAERLGAVGEGGPPSAREQSMRRDVVRRVDEIRQALSKMDAEARELQALGARVAAREPVRALEELQVSLATAIDVARLPGAEG